MQQEGSSHWIAAVDLQAMRRAAVATFARHKFDGLHPTDRRELVERYFRCDKRMQVALLAGFVGINKDADRF